MKSELASTFSSALLLLAVYFWYDTMKMIITNRIGTDEMSWIVVSVVVTFFVIWAVVVMKQDTDALESGPPPGDRKIKDRRGDDI
jgi:hypothetical protein